MRLLRGRIEHKERARARQAHAEADEKDVMSIFYGKYDEVSKDQINMAEETNAWNILLITYKIENEHTSITLWSSEYGIMSVGNNTKYVKFHDGVHKQLLKYLEKR